jgi:hypothetical protein
MTAPTWFRGAVLAALAACIATGCKVDKEKFHERIYSCNPNAADPACGTDLDNQPMACVAAYQLGGRNFCATGCDATTTAPEASPEAICLPSGKRSAGLVSGALLPRCNPDVQPASPGAPPPNPCGHDELSCLRTDMLSSEGVCMTVNSCGSDSDCRDPVRAKCIGQLLHDTYGDKAGLKIDRTYCVQFGCRERRTACSPGETCLRDVIPKSSNPSDICVPNCDSNGNCPPNYFCYPDIYSKASPSVCIPGLLGLRCRSRLDCLFGDCVASGAGYNVCSVKCTDDAQCAKFDSEHGTFFCNAEGWCAGARAFRGGQCLTDDDCLYKDGPPEICARITNTSRYGSCLRPCEKDSCPSYGGVPHACRPQIDAKGDPDPLGPLPWVCWPGYFGQLCKDDTNCIPSLGCKPVVPPLLKICSVACNSDDDCLKNRFAKDGWCDPQLHICRSPFADDTTGCDRNTQCESKSCIPDPMSTVKAKKCDKTPGY